MADFGLGGLIGGGFGFAGALINAEEQAETRKMNWAIAKMNYEQRERERSEAIAMALKQRREQQLGTTDAEGTRTKFIPGIGWVTELGDDPKQRLAAQNKEQAKVLGYDLPERRKAMGRNISRSFEEANTADSLKRMFQNQLASGPVTDSAYENELRTAQNRGIREASDDAGTKVWRQAMRTGNNSNFDNIAAGLQRENNKSYADAALKAKLMSRGTALKEQQERTGNLANLYNMFANRAGMMPDVNYRPQNIDTSGNTQQSMQGMLSAGAQAVAASGKKGGEMDYLSPLTGFGNALAGLGSNLSSTFGKMQAKNAYEGGQGGVTGFGSSSQTAQGSMYRDDEEA